MSLCTHRFACPGELIHSPQSSAAVTAGIIHLSRTCSLMRWLYAIKLIPRDDRFTTGRSCVWRLRTVRSFSIPLRDCVDFPCMYALNHFAETKHKNELVNTDTSVEWPCGCAKVLTSEARLVAMVWCVRTSRRPECCELATGCVAQEGMISQSGMWMKSQADFSERHNAKVGPEVRTLL